ncbi:MAG: heat-inducible transcriptional repressor HrcA [Culicoidibacterales bacterium]
MLTERRLLLLKAIVDEFILSAQPVGSKILTQKYALPFSSATVRNEMAKLEQLGLLEKTHTSSGRVPSRDGYRYYVDYLIEPTQTSIANEWREFERIFQQKNRMLQDVIEQTVQLTAKKMKHIVVFLGASSQANRIVQFKMFPVSHNQAALVIVTEQGQTDTRFVIVPEPFTLHELDLVVKFFNQYLHHVPLNQVLDKIDKELVPLISTYVPNYEFYHQALVDCFATLTTQQVYYSGQANVIGVPDFSDLEKVKQLFDFLEDNQAVTQLKTNKIGTRIVMSDDIQGLPDTCVAVTATMRLPLGGHGTFAIIGPTRMDYVHAISLLQFIAQHIVHE